MKKAILALILLPLFLLPSNAQTQNSDLQTLKQINEAVIEKYKAGKFDDALKAARQSLDLTIKLYGAENKATAVIFTNLGEIYRAKQKHSEAAENFQKALTIYEKNPAQNKTAITKILETLGIVLALDGKKEQAESFFTKYVADTETLYGEDGKEVIPALKSLSDFYIYSKQYEKVDDIFIKRYLLTRKIFGKGSDELGEIRDDYHCFANQNFSAEDGDERRKRYEDALGKFLSPDKKPDDVGVRKINAGVINGKALSLPKPEYPSEARKAGAAGSVLVKVSIDEQGKVYEAKAFCGNPLLRKGSEESAKNSKFSPTLLNGLPVKVVGVIVYNYVR